MSVQAYCMQSQPERLERLGRAFALSQLQTEIIQFLFALQQSSPDEPGLFEGLALPQIVAGLGRERAEIRHALSGGSVLVRDGFLHAEGDPRSPVFFLDPHLADHLAGSNALDPDARPALTDRSAALQFDKLDLNPSERERLAAISERLSLSGARGQVVLAGPPGVGRGRAAQALASALNMRLFALDLYALKHPRPERAEQMLHRALREARLHHAALCIREHTEWQANAGTWLQRALDRELRAWHGLAIFIEEKTPRALESSTLICEFDRLEPAQRMALWTQVWPEGDPESVADFAGRYNFTAGQIRGAVERARIEAQLSGRQPAEQDMVAGAIGESRHRLEELALKIDPVFTWEDLILPADKQALLRELVVRVQKQALVYDTWGFGRKLPYGRGVSALFYGESGTGKTMAAQVIARELGRELYRTEMSRVISRYVGETEKNLARIFAEAKHSHAVVMFDEADALFARRTEIQDAHDRYANLETAYLLQEIERHAGLCILATNLPANMDDAFQRRLAVSIRFPSPESPERFRLLQSFIPHGAPLAPDVNLEVLADKAVLAGGGLKNIVLAAAFRAAGEGSPISMKHLLNAARAECAKAGAQFLG